MLHNQKVLVTGGAGFIGSNLCQKLLELDNEVVCLDNLSTGHYANIERFEENSNFQFIKGDIIKLSDCQVAVKGIDYVFHEAALGSVPRSIDDPIRTNASNITGFLNMIVAARDASVKRFIYAASSSTYGDSKELPKREEKIGNPMSPYAVTKYVNELYANVFHQLYDLEVVGLRYFNVYGPYQDPNGAYAAVIPKFINLLIKGEAPLINGDGTYSRDFTYVDNVVHANLLAAASNNKDVAGNVFNVACGEQTSLNVLVDVLKEELGVYESSIKKIETQYGPLRKGDIPHSMASIEKGKKILGYAPVVKVEEGLKRTCDYFYNKATE